MKTSLVLLFLLTIDVGAAFLAGGKSWLAYVLFGTVLLSMLAYLNLFFFRAKEGRARDHG